MYGHESASGDLRQIHEHGSTQHAGAHGWWCFMMLLWRYAPRLSGQNEIVWQLRCIAVTKGWNRLLDKWAIDQWCVFGALSWMVHDATVGADGSFNQMCRP